MVRNTDNHKWPVPEDDDEDYEVTFDKFFDELDGDVVLRGNLSARPSAGEEGRVYLSNDSGTETLYYDNGSSWTSIAGTNMSSKEVEVGGLSINGWNFVDVVEAGADNSGNTVTSDEIQDMVSNKTVLIFREGTYLFSDTINIDVDQFGVIGRTGATIEVRTTFSGGTVFSAGTSSSPAKEIYFENINLSCSEDGAGETLITSYATDELIIKDISINDGIYSGPALYGCLTDEDGVGEINRASLPHGAEVTPDSDGSGLGPTGILIDSNHNGRMRVKDCNVQDFSDNGLYASSAPGYVYVEGGVFRNNNISNIRVGDGDVVESAVVEVSRTVENKPSGTTDNQRGIWIKSGEASVQDCELSYSGGTGIPLQTSGDANGCSIKGTSVVVNNGNQAVDIKPANSSVDTSEFYFEDCVFETTTSGSEAKELLLVNRDNATFHHCHLDADAGSSTYRDGLKSNNRNTSIRGGSWKADDTVADLTGNLGKVHGSEMESYNGDNEISVSGNGTQIRAVFLSNGVTDNGTGTIKRDVMTSATGGGSIEGGDLINSTVDNTKLDNDSVDVAGNSVSLGSSTTIDYVDLNDTGSSFPIPNSDLSNSSIEVAGNSVSLGGSTNVDYVDLNDTGASFPIPNSDLSNSSVTVAGNSISLGGSSAIDHSDISNQNPDDHHAKYTDEEAQDAVGGILSGGTNVSITYDDANDSITVDTSALDAEEVEDQVNTLLSGGTSIETSYDDANDTLTISVSDSSIDTTQLASSAVTAAKIASGAVGADELENDSVTIAGNEVSLGGSTTPSLSDFNAPTAEISMGDQTVSQVGSLEFTDTDAGDTVTSLIENSSGDFVVSTATDEWMTYAADTNRVQFDMGGVLQVFSDIWIMDPNAGLDLTSGTSGNARYGLKYGSANNVGDNDNLMLTNRETGGDLLLAANDGTGGGEALGIRIPGGSSSPIPNHPNGLESGGDPVPKSSTGTEYDIQKNGTDGQGIINFKTN